jgi:glycosyltransferase involved in cell wall biosynthesis
VKILLLTRYASLGASSRLRSFQYIPYLESKGWQIEVNYLFSNDYVRALYRGSSLYHEVIKGFWKRLKMLMKLKQYDVVWVEKELFPFFPSFAERLLNSLGIPYMVDYDDALFHRYDQHRSLLIRTILGKKIDMVMNKSALVIAGNKYLASRAKLAGANQVKIIPTVIDLERYNYKTKVSSEKELIIGWIGSPSTTHYLLDLNEVFMKLKKKFHVRVVAVGASSPALKKSDIDVVPWSEKSEVDSIQKFDIGIMPLTDSPWERGKCGYKLIQYMACGLPVIGSPVGINKDIIEHGVNGFLAQSLREWENALSKLLERSDMRLEMGRYGRKRVEDWYSLQIQAPRLQALLEEVVKGSER